MDEIAKVLIEQWKYDIEVMSQPWMYWTLLVPAVVYFMFFMLKWTFITAPAWLPIAIIVSAFRRNG